MSIIYRGYAPENHAGGRMVTVWDGNRFISVLPHVVKHSPSGFSWGYAGSGPAELARCVLIHALELAPDCDECGGHGCWWCDGGYTEPSPAMYQQFKFDRIAGLPRDEGWEITESEVKAWAAAWRSSHPQEAQRRTTLGGN
ncbi:hypothetical protein H7I87_00315 [Mycobacterium timonense]|uniref:Uncharacterized protein n=1 Tax=Mycobacterium bouchedurhonense TaxID=701041 RepID=A0AAW5S1F0_MYCBC|nr:MULTISPECIES: DUF6166 domain-containing protein [Mycobacterium avium complex (MAC)]MCV6988662.1 hypothetical protein [Mycobacterium bouchedurhonense]MCV6993210.1 hypothetical protein [Mycobacterium timonense]MDV3306428.1 hypothetical protein [Mycobacterium avium subsp. hominissuis]